LAAGSAETGDPNTEMLTSHSLQAAGVKTKKKHPFLASDGEKILDLEAGSLEQF